MILSEKTLQELRDMINEKTTYRSGPTFHRNTGVG